MKLVEFTTEPLNELSNELLGKYKQAAEKKAREADKAENFDYADKRFDGILKAHSKMRRKTDQQDTPK